MTDYWPRSRLLRAPGMHPAIAAELVQAQAVGGVTPITLGFVRTAITKTIPLNMPITLVRGLDAKPNQLYLHMPAPWEFHSTEPVGVIETAEGPFFFNASVN